MRTDPSRFAALLLAIGQILSAQSGFVIPLAGGYPPATPVNALNVPLPYGEAIVRSPAGEIYVLATHYVYKISTSGLMTRLVGDPSAEASLADGIPALTARIVNGNGLALDPAGNLYIADTGSHRIRKVTAAGIITTVAGNGTSGFSGDGGPAALAALNSPTGVAVDPLGALIISDAINNRVRKVTPGGIITTVAGTGVAGYSGDGGPGTQAQLYYPQAVVTDSSGNVYISDRQNSRIRKLSREGIISTFAGTGVSGSAGDGGPATSAELNGPFGLALDSAGALYIADMFGRRVRRVGTDGIISTYAGNGTSTPATDGIPAVQAGIVPMSVFPDGSGGMLVTVEGGLRRVNSVGIISTLAGDRGGAGDGGLARSAIAARAEGIEFDPANQSYYIAGDNSLSPTAHRVRRFAPGGIIETIAGSDVDGFSGDGGPARSAQLSWPRALARDGNGNLYVCDTGNARVRKIDASGIITTFAGSSGPLGDSGDGGPATSAVLNGCRGLATDTSGNLFISTLHKVRKVNSSGTISTVAGTGTRGFSGDGGPATSATLNTPSGLAVGPDGSIFIADYSNCRIRRVDLAGMITTVAGTGACGFSGDGGPAASAALNRPQDVGFDSTGNLYIADRSNGRLRRVSPAGVITTVAGGGPYELAGYEVLPATQAMLPIISAIAVDSRGNVAMTENREVALYVPPATSAVLKALILPPPILKSGTTTSFEIRISNAAGAALPAPFTQVELMMPSGLSAPTLSGPGWSCGGISCFRSDPLSPGASYPPITLQVAVSYSPPPQVTMMARVRGGVVEVVASSTVNADVSPPCIYSISPWVFSVPSSASSRTAVVNTGAACPWSAVSNAPWITVTNPGARTGSYHIGFAVQANPGTLTRTGLISAGNSTLTVQQAGAAACSYSVSPTQISATAAGDIFRLSVGTAPNCWWNSVSGVDWVHATSGAGPGTASVSVMTNTGTFRSTTVQVAGTPIAVLQAGHACGAEDLTPFVALQRGPFSRTGERTYYQTVTVRNVSGQTIQGPIFLVLLGLPRFSADCPNGCYVVTPLPPTYCYSVGGSSRVLLVNGVFLPNQIVTQTVHFSGWLANPINMFNYTPIVIRGNPSY
jgi:sugar lactone lactonase YvrE